MGLGGLTVTPHTSLSQRVAGSGRLIGKDRENTAISSSPPAGGSAKSHEIKGEYIEGSRYKHHPDVPKSFTTTDFIYITYSFILVKEQYRKGNHKRSRNKNGSLLKHN